jgi:hypothetical protein
MVTDGQRLVHGVYSTMAAVLLGALSYAAVAQNLVKNGSFAVTGGTTSRPP